MGLFSNTQIGYNGGKMEIKKLITIERSGYQDQYLRSFQLDINYNTLNSLENMVQKKKYSGINNIKGVDVSNVIPDAMMPTSTPERVGRIANGWGEKRALFMLEASVKNANGYSETIYYVQGYTEYWDLSIGGKMSDDMKFYMNTLLVLQRTYNPNNGTIHTRVVDNFSIVHDDTSATFTVNNNKSLFKDNETIIVARPDDVLVTITQQQLFNGNSNGIEIVPSTLLSVNGNSATEPVLVDRTKGTTPAGHIATTMTGVLQAQASSDIGYGSEDIYDHAATITRTKSAEDILFIRKLTEIHGLNSESYFTLDDLRTLDPSFNQDKFFILKSGNPYRKPNETQLLNGDTSHTYAPTEENRIVSLVSTSLTTYMSEYGLLYAMVSISNVNGLPEVTPLGGNTMIEGLNVGGMLTKLTSKIVNELVPVITRQNMQMIELLADIDLLGNSVITISINGSNPEVVNVPAAMDGVTSPIITNTTNFNNLVSGYKTMADTITVSGM